MHQNQFLRGCMFIAGLILLPSIILAQTPAPSPPPPTNAIFVPYEKMTGPKFGKDQSILVPYAEFLKLKKAAETRPDSEDFRPVAALVQSSYKGVIADTLVRIDAELIVDVLARAKDTLEVILPFEGVAIEKSAIEGASGTLGPLDSGAGFRLIMQGAGRRTLIISLAVPLKSEGGAKRLDFRVPRAAASSLELSSKEKIAIESQEQSVPATITENPDGSAVIRAATGSTERILLMFRPGIERVGAAAQTRFSIHQEIAARLSSKQAEFAVQLKGKIHTGSLKSLAVQLPAGVQLRDVAGSFVKDWSAPDAAGLFEIALIREIVDEFSLQINASMPLSSPIFNIPEFRVPGAVAESGLVRINPDSWLTVWVEDAAGLEAASQPADGAAGGKAYLFGQPGWALKVNLRPVPQRLRSEAVILYEVTEEFVRIKTRHNLNVGGRGLFDVEMEVPKGFQLREAGPANLVASYRQKENRIEIGFRGEQRGNMTIELDLQRPRAAGESKVSLNPISAVGAEEDLGIVVLAVPRALRATELEARGLEAADVRNLMDRVNPLLSADLVPALAYKFFTPDFQTLLAIERQRTRINCETSRLVSIMPSLMRQDATFNYNVEFSATDTFQILLPASAGEDVRFTASDIKEKFHAPIKKESLVDNELTTWTIRLQRRVIGAWTLRLSFDMPLPAAESGKTVKVGIPPLRTVNTARESGFIAVSRGENLEVRVADSTGLESRDIKELPPQLANAFLGFRYFDPVKQSLELELVRHEMEAVLGALIRRVHIDTVLNDQREATHEVIFEVQNNREQYLELDLPKEVQIWSAFVRGMPVHPITRQSDGARLIELTKSESKDMAFRVRLILKETLPGGDLKGGGKLIFNPPKPINLPILRATWKLYLPRGYLYYDFGGSMRLEKGGRPSWVEPATDKLLNDIPAAVAGGAASPDFKPPVSSINVDYDHAETQEEKAERLKSGAAMEISITREGVQYVFSKLSGIGSVEMRYQKARRMLFMQAGAALIIFVLLLLIMKASKSVLPGFAAALILLIAASLTGGLAGRLLISSFAASAAAFVIGLVLLTIQKRKSQNSI